MRIEMTKHYCTLYREPGDKALSHESTVGYHMKQLLNAQGHKFVRMNPSNGGLTACTLGLIEHKSNVGLWHERYAVEMAHKAFNSGSVTFQRVEGVMER